MVDTQGFLDVEPGDPVPLGLDYVVERIRSGEWTMLRPDDAVAQLRILIDELDEDTAGQLLNIDGSILPW